MRFLTNSPLATSKTLGGISHTVLDAVRTQSPVGHQDAFAKLPVLHRGADYVVPVAHSQQFVKAMVKRGYEEVPRGRHAKSLLHGFEDDIVDFFDAANAARSQKPQGK